MKLFEKKTIQGIGKMYNEASLREFLNNSDKRISNLLSHASKLRFTVNFLDAAKSLEAQIEGSKVHFYGTRIMQLGHGKSHLNMYFEVGEYLLSICIHGDFFRRKF